MEKDCSLNKLIKIELFQPFWGQVAGLCWYGSKCIKEEYKTAVILTCKICICMMLLHLEVSHKMNYI